MAKQCFGKILEFFSLFYPCSVPSSQKSKHLTDKVFSNPTESSYTCWIRISRYYTVQNRPILYCSCTVQCTLCTVCIYFNLFLICCSAPLVYQTIGLLFIGQVGPSAVPKTIYFQGTLCSNLPIPKTFGVPCFGNMYIYIYQHDFKSFLKVVCFCFALFLIAIFSLQVLYSATWMLFII